MRKIADTEGPATWFVPNYRARDITDIDFAMLAKQGVNRIAIDVDGTLLPAGNLGDAHDVFITHITEAQKAGHIKKLIIATNRFPLFARKVGQWMKADVVVTGSLFRRKPSKAYYDQVIDSLGGKPSETAMIGDRLLQDIFGGNKAGMSTILVDDLGPEPWYDKIVFHRIRQHRRLKHLDQKLQK